MIPFLQSLVRRSIDKFKHYLFPEAQTAKDQWLRIVSNQAINQYVKTLQIPLLDVAEISGNSHASHSWKSYRNLNYPEFDLCGSIHSLEQSFDLIFCEHVLEHVVDPWSAVANLKNLCRPGGKVIIATPFLVRVHELPMYAMFDYWRFTPRGMQLLLEKNGLEVLKIDCWGNRACVKGNMKRWLAFRAWYSLRNEENIPLVIWAIARRI